MVLWSMLTLLSLVGCITLYKHLGPIKASNKIKKIKIHVKVSNPCEECNGKVSQASITIIILYTVHIIYMYDCISHCI